MTRNDEQIKKDIVDELYWDPRVNAADVAVTVQNGAAMLSGDVPTYADLAGARAATWRVPGVVNVVDDVAVKYIAPPALPTDQEIQTQVINILTWEPVIDVAQISVAVSNGKVDLEGTVDAYWKKSYAENKILGLRGLLSIENKLAVVPSQQLADEAIAQRIIGAFDRDASIEVDEITVSVDDGVVTLSGRVSGWAVRRAAEDSAALTRGVVDVRNNLEIAD